MSAFRRRGAEHGHEHVSPAVSGPSAEAYRVGAKAWSRDALLSGLALLFAGVFVVQPFLDWSEQGRMVAGEREQVRQTQERVVAGERGIGGLLGALAEAREAAAATAETLAADLAQRLRWFADLVRRLDERVAAPAPELTPPASEPTSQVQWPQANFPGAAIAQQSALPPQLLPELLPAPLLAEPADVLRQDFGLTEEDLEQFRRGLAEGEGSRAWQIASATSERVFKREIERSYGELERRVGAQLAAIRDDLADGLAELAMVSELGAPLPAPEQLLPQTTVVRLPSEDELFRTVAGKALAFRGVGLYQINLNLDAASAPLHRATALLTEASDRLEGQRAALERQRVAIEGELRALDDRLATIRGELGGLGAPLQWLAIDTASFVLLHPTLVALAALWLAVRYRRLEDLGARLEAGFAAWSLLEMTPIIGLAVLLSPAVRASGADGLVSRAFARHRGTAIVLSSALGAITPICGVGVLPIVAGLLAAGVPLAPVMAFWLASPVTDPGMLVITAGTLGLPFAVGKTAFAGLIGIFGGAATAVLMRAGAFGSPLRRARSPWPPATAGSWPHRSRIDGADVGDERTSRLAPCDVRRPGLGRWSRWPDPIARLVA